MKFTSQQFGFGLLIVLIPIFSSHFQPENENHLLISEVFYSPPGLDADNEWVEIVNSGNVAVNLSDVKLGDEEQTWGGEGMMRFPDGSQIAPGGVIVIAQKAVGFRSLYGRDPDYEMTNSIDSVPDLVPYKIWSDGEIALANDGDEVLLLDEHNARIDVINYGDRDTFFSPSIGDVFEGQSIERIPAHCDTDTAADWQPQRFPTPGKVTIEGQCSEIIHQSLLEDDGLTIGEIQGSGDVSPYVNQLVTIQGVVTGIHEDRNADGIIFYSLFVQNIPDESDGDVATSDGIAVFLGRNVPDFQIGQMVTVSGRVNEYFGLTEIDDDDLEIRMESFQPILPDPVQLIPPANPEDRVDYYEALEGMLVEINQDVQVAGPTHAGCGFDVFDSEVNTVLPPIQTPGDIDRRIITILHHSDVDCSDLLQVKTGDRVAGARGPLTFHFDRYKIVHQQIEDLILYAAEPPGIEPAKMLGDHEISIVTYNFANFFDGQRDMLNVVADPITSPELLSVKKRKLEYVISSILMCPTVIAVQEVEKVDLLNDLAAGLEEQCGFRYRVNHEDGPDSRGLDVAMLTHPEKVQVNGMQSHQTCTAIQTGIIDPNLSCPSNENPLFGRPPLQLDTLINGVPINLITAHLKSKRGDEIETEKRRIAQGDYLNQAALELAKEDPNAAIILLGDFNDYENSTTMQAIQKGDLLWNVLEEVPLNDRYSYIFDGRTQLIDGILLSKNVVGRVRQTKIFHINADFPVGLAKDLSMEGLPYHSSDHDIPFVIMELGPVVEQVSDESPAISLEPTAIYTNINDQETQSLNSTEVVIGKPGGKQMVDRKSIVAGAVLLLVPFLIFGLISIIRRKSF